MYCMELNKDFDCPQGAICYIKNPQGREKASENEEMRYSDTTYSAQPLSYCR